MARRHHRWGRWLIVGVVTLLVGLVVHLLTRPPEALVDRIRGEPVVLAIALTGRVAPRLEAELSSLVAGRLVTLTKNEGERVSAGEVLGRVEVEIAEAELQRARAAQAAQAARLQQLERDLERVRDLYRSEVVARQELEQAELEADVARAELQSLTKALEQARERLGDHLLVAPFDGVVLERPVDPGQVVQPQTLVYRVATVEDRLVEVDVDERYLSVLSVGMKATVSAIGSQVQRSARVVFVGEDVDPAAGTAIVRLSFDDPSPDLPSGLSIDVNIIVQELERALTVARQAVMDVDGTERVLVVDGRHLREREIDVVDWQAERIVVTRGLAIGERVVLNPREYEPGQSVRPVDVERG